MLPQYGNVRMHHGKSLWISCDCIHIVLVLGGILEDWAEIFNCGLVVHDIETYIKICIRGKTAAIARSELYLLLKESEDGERYCCA